MPNIFLKLFDIADLPVGHVPRSLAGLCRSVLDEGGNIYLPRPQENQYPL
jgi:hypothetical protein